MDNPLNNVTVDYTGVSVETAEAFNTTISGLSEEYMSGITQVRVADPKETFGARFFAKVEANDDIGQRTLLINPHKCKDNASMVDRIRALSDAGKCVRIPVGKEGEYVATHEFAHGLLNMGEGGKSLVGMDWKKTRSARKEIRAMYQEYMDEIRGIEAEIEELRKSPAFTDFSADPGEQMEAFRKLKEARERLESIRISEYSMENADEFMAEAFTRNRIGLGRSKYTDRVMDVLDREYRIEKDMGSDIIKSGAISGARNPYGEAAKEHARKYYGLVRSMTTDVQKIAETTGFPEIEIQRIKNYVFMEKHDLGGEEPEFFEPDFMMAESWRRLQAGTPEPHDITLLHHERMERELMQQGMSQEEAHIITTKKYNYGKEAAEFYDKIKKYRKE